MDIISFKSLYNDATKAIKDNQLLQALSFIKGMLFTLGDIETSHEYESICQDYDIMLEFMAKGGEDIEREKVYHNIFNRIYNLLDKISRLYRLKNKSDYYSICFNSLTTDLDSLKEEILREEKIEEETKSLSNTYNQIFNYIWTSPLYKETEAEALKDYIQQLNPQNQALLISAIMLNLLEYFDIHKYNILISFCYSEENIVRVRAIIATVFILMKYEYRIVAYPELSRTITSLYNDEKVKNELIILQLQLLLSLETSKVENKLQKEIFPNILKINKQQNIIGLTEVEEELSKALEGNIKEDLLFSDKRLAINMKEIIEMGQEGIDINIGTFSNLKSFPFFRQVANWFRPFDSHYLDIKKLFDEDTSNKSIKTLISSGSLCDSDKYSLCLMLCSLSKEQSEMMTSQFELQLTDNQEQIKELDKHSKSIKYIYRFYLQDLYRFFKLHPNKSDFENPFKRNLLLTEYDILSKSIQTTDYLIMMVPAMIKRGFYQDAIKYINAIIKSEGADLDSLKKLAYCHQKNNAYNQAIYYYQQADLISPDNDWILQQMRTCYAALGEYDQEYDCLKKLKEIHPEDNHITAQLGLCYMQLNKYEEAANCFYELEYKGERLLHSWKALGWCNFKINKLDQAEKYYTKILQQNKVEWSDFLNAGHVAWCQNKIAEAIKYYKKYISLIRKQKGNANVLIPFDKDTNELLKHGISQVEIYLMRDIITAN